MKKIIQKALASLLVVAIVITYACNSFAANDYGINYSGGTPLGASNVIIDPTLTDDLKPLMASATQTPNSAPGWRSGYMDDTSGCKPINYFTVSYNDPVDTSDNIGFTISNAQYRTDVKVKKATLEGATAETGSIPVGIMPNGSYIYGGWQPYIDSSCTEKPEGVALLRVKDNVRLFVELNLKLHKKNETDVFVSRGLYFGITDIDAAQSYKILNEGNQLETNNMFARSAESLQPTDTSATLKNMFNQDQHYVYSEYDAEEGTVLAIDGYSNLFTQLHEDTQEDGLDIVFGFMSPAGSGVQYYAKQYTVTYTSEEQGRITGITSEKIIGGENPSGSEATPDGYWEFCGWTADKNVKLRNGDEIPEGVLITDEEIKDVIVNDDIEFTAHYESEEFEIVYTTDGHGTITGIEDEVVYTHGNPSGSEQEPNTGYTFIHWISDESVTLTDGTVIPAGTPITDDQIQKVVVTENLVFTAIYETNDYTVTYTSDENGAITGKTEEGVEYGKNPTGTMETPNEGYEFKEWIADVDVTLTDGTTIKAGDPITPSQISLIVVDKDIKLTAINKAKEELVVPDTGSITKEGNNAEFTIISISTVVALASLLLISLMPKFFRKKIDFGK